MAARGNRRWLHALACGLGALPLAEVPAAVGESSAVGWSWHQACPAALRPMAGSLQDRFRNLPLPPTGSHVGHGKPGAMCRGPAWLHVLRCRMGSSVSVRELRNKVSEVLRRVESGERVTVTVDRRPVAELVPLRRRRTVSASEAMNIVSRHAADSGMLREVRSLLTDTTDDA